jgi:hypothetical protein
MFAMMIPLDILNLGICRYWGPRSDGAASLHLEQGYKNSRSSSCLSSMLVNATIAQVITGPI